MLQLDNISLYRNGNLLFKNVNFCIYDGQALGLIGKNGSGKTSFLSLLRGELTPDSGDINLAKRRNIAHVSQTLVESELPALEFVLTGDAEYTRIQNAIKSAEAKEDWDQLAPLYTQLEEIDGYNTPIRAQQILSGLRFSDQDFLKPVNAFSGGWRSRLGLAQALMTPSEVLLLDEPTNHLDMHAISWLEQWLKTYRGALIIVSHDCAFLDNVISHVLYLDNQTMNISQGNYTQFIEQRALQIALQQKQYAAIQKKEAHLNAFISRFKAKASKAKQAQSRIKALARLETVEQVFQASPFKFEFKQVSEPPPLLMKFDKIDIGYNDVPILNKVSCSIRAGSRLGIIGMNGAGKSTFIKALAGVLPPLKGEAFWDKRLRLGYFAQHEVEQLNDGLTAANYFQTLFPDVQFRDIRNYLATFNFTGDKSLQAIGQMSGGEKARLVLSIINWQAPNLLLLDEPTNHLDLEMREALTMSLQTFEGAIVLISHDRQLISENCNELLLIETGTCKIFPSDIHDYYSTITSSVKI
ncbi:MAG: transporter ATP-binding protein [Francisellaceae bacterium]|nr:transporter ATP-binding protein [Francisellaceae bacterium]